MLPHSPGVPPGRVVPRTSVVAARHPVLMEEAPTAVTCGGQHEINIPLRN